MSSVKKNTIFNFLLSFSSILFPFVTMPYISRILVINDIGILNKGSAVYALFVNLASFGVAGYGAREIARQKDNKEYTNSIFSSVLFCHFIAVSFFLIVYFIYIIFSTPESERLIHLLYISLFAITPLSIEWFYIGREDFSYIAFRSFFVKIILLILVFVLVHNADDFIIYAIIFITAQGVNYLFNIIHSRKYVQFSLKKLHILHTFYVSKFFYFQTLVAVCYQNINQLILGHNEVQLALFVRAVSFSTLIAAVISPVSNAIKPRLEYVISQNPMQYRCYVNNAFDCIFSILCPVVLGMIALSTNITLIFGGEQFASGAVVLAACCVGAFVTQIATFLNYIISTPAGFEKNTFLSNMLVAIIALFFNPIFIKKFGALGAAFTLVLAESSGVILHLILIKKKKLYSGWIDFRKSKYLFSAFIMFVAVVLIKRKISNIYLQSFIGFLIGIFVYIVFVLLFTRVFRDSKPYLLQSVLSIIGGESV